jgi:hypothetical protein
MNLKMCCQTVSGRETCQVCGECQKTCNLINFFGARGFPLTSFYQIEQVRPLADQIAKSFTSVVSGIPWGIAEWLRFNIRYESDIENYGDSDYWQFPTETLQRRSGDCEDFAFLAASLLRAKGYSNARVIYGSVTFGLDQYLRGLGVTPSSQGHMWVEYSDWGGWRVLEGTGGVVLPMEIARATGYNQRNFEVFPDHCESDCTVTKASTCWDGSKVVLQQCVPDTTRVVKAGIYSRFGVVPAIYQGHLVPTGNTCPNKYCAPRDPPDLVINGQRCAHDTLWPNPINYWTPAAEAPGAAAVCIDGETQDLAQMEAWNPMG